MSGSFPNKSTTRLLIVAGKSLGWIPVKVTKLTRHEYPTQLWAGLIKNIPKLEPRRPTILFTHFPLGEAVFARPLNTDDYFSGAMD
jgi:hypothetical protein